MAKQYDADKSYRNDCLAKGVEADKSKLNNPNYFKIKKQFNSIKREQFPFVIEVTKCSSEEAIIQLGKSFNNFFEKRAKYPKFRKKCKNEGFSLSNSEFKLVDINNNSFIRVPKLGLVKMSEKLRFDGKILSAKIFTRGDKWFVSIAVGLSEIRMILPIYKADMQNKTVKELDRFYPSSKTCSCCGFKLEKLPLSIRAWTCPNCKTSHDRDVNASLNILNNAAKVLTVH